MDRLRRSAGKLEPPFRLVKVLRTGSAPQLQSPPHPGLRYGAETDLAARSVCVPKIKTRGTSSRIKRERHVSLRRPDPEKRWIPGDSNSAGHRPAPEFLQRDRGTEAGTGVQHLLLEDDRRTEGVPNAGVLHPRRVCDGQRTPFTQPMQGVPAHREQAGRPSDDAGGTGERIDFVAQGLHHRRAGSLEQRGRQKACEGPLFSNPQRNAGVGARTSDPTHYVLFKFRALREANRT